MRTRRKYEDYCLYSIHFSVSNDTCLTIPVFVIDKHICRKYVPKCSDLKQMGRYALLTGAQRFGHWPLSFELLDM